MLRREDVPIERLHEGSGGGGAEGMPPSAARGRAVRRRDADSGAGLLPEASGEILAGRGTLVTLVTHNAYTALGYGAGILCRGERRIDELDAGPVGWQWRWKERHFEGSKCGQQTTPNATAFDLRSTTAHQGGLAHAGNWAGATVFTVQRALAFRARETHPVAGSGSPAALRGRRV